MKKIAIIGAGDLGQLIAHHAPQCSNLSVVGYFDDYANKNSLVRGLPVLGLIKDTESFFALGKFDSLMIGIGYNHMKFRKDTFESFSGKIPFEKLIHPSSFVDPSVVIGEGSFVLPGCTIDVGSKLGNNVLLNTGSTIAHDTTICNHSFLAPAVAVAGKTIINECCILGINCTIIDNLLIGKNIRIGAGSLVLKNIEIPGMYAGVPAVLKKQYSDL